jgi:Fe-S-cluster containining protein
VNGTPLALYNCRNCPGYCCSYPLIALNKRDVERLAKHFDLAPDKARKKFTKKAFGHEYVMRRKADPHYGRICQFFDQKERCCSIYKARPAICRSFPGTGRCGYYDFLMFERRTQDDPKWVATTNSD